MSSDTFVIKPYKPEFADVLANLISYTIITCYPSVYSREVVDFFLSYHSKSELKLKVEKAEFICGFIGDDIIATGYLNNEEIGGVYVHPDFQRRGYGRIIVQELLTRARIRKLDFVWLDSTPLAYKLYLDLGFILQDELIEYVGENNIPLKYYKMKLYL